jgi:hypothetical protein
LPQIRPSAKVADGLREATAQTMMDGLQVYCNFLRPHTALDGKTSAQKAKLVSDDEKTNWASLIKKSVKNKKFEFIFCKKHKTTYRKFKGYFEV